MGNRLNVIDENNVVVGFDYTQDCCEDFGYYFTLKEPVKYTYNDEPKLTFNHDEYFFDTSYHKNALDLDEYGDEYGDGEACSFKLVNKKEAEVFLVLYNCHNGYYGHGFDMKIGGDVKYEGIL